jgi:hypothetical protein
VHIFSPGKTGCAAAIALALSFWQIKFKGSLREVVKIITVDMPGKNPEFSLSYGFLLSFFSTALVAEIAASGVAAALPATTLWRT